MNVLVAGATGFIGLPLCRALARAGHRVTVLTRSGARAQALLPEGIHLEEWDAKTVGPWAAAAAAADVCINLAGASIGAGRWTAARKRAIVESRVQATRALVKALAGRGKAAEPPLLINASGKDVYGPRGDEPLDESAPAGKGFLAETCILWEREARRAEEAGARVVLFRLGLVLGSRGALDRIQLPFKLYLGGTLGPGTQWVSWIHRQDVVGAMLHLIEMFRRRDPRLSGPVNAVAPTPVSMRTFCRAIGRSLSRPVWLPAPAPLLRAVLGEMADLILFGQRAVPQKLLEWEYPFQYTELDAALRDVNASAGERRAKAP